MATTRFAGEDTDPASGRRPREPEAETEAKAEESSRDERDGRRHELVEVERSKCGECGTAFTDAFECPECGSRDLTSEVVVLERPTHR